MKRLATALVCAFLTPGIAVAGTVDDVRSAGVVTCGLDPEWPGFSVRNEDYSWSGFHVDLCRAIAAAVVGDAKKANLTAVFSDERIVALQSGEIDVLFHRIPWTQGADVRHGLMFVTPMFFMPVATIAPDHPLGEDTPSALTALSPMVRQGDDQWFHVVRAVMFALQTQPFDRDAAIDSALSLEPGWPERAIAAAGNFKEIVARHFPPGTADAPEIDGETGLPKGFTLFAPP